jgi:anaerobic glycerol-3-phosphate dehydrogenase
MAYTAKQIKDLNRMNASAQNVALGTTMGNLMAVGNIVSGSHTVTAAEASASRVVIDTGLDAVVNFFPAYIRSGSPLTQTWASGSVAGTLTIVNSASASPIAGDIATYLVV